MNFPAAMECTPAAIAVRLRTIRAPCPIAAGADACSWRSVTDSASAVRRSIRSRCGSSCIRRQ